MRHLLRIFKLSLRISQKEPKQSHPVSAELISSVPIIYYANKKGDRTKICRLFLSNILLRRCFWSRRCCRSFWCCGRFCFFTAGYYYRCQKKNQNHLFHFISPPICFGSVIQPQNHTEFH